MLFAESCLSCGVVLLPRDAKRRKRPSQLRKTLRECWVQTCLVWAAIEATCNATPETETIPLCMSCVHWLHRVERRRAGLQTMLIMDCLLLFCRLPLTAPLPDVRLLRRLLAALDSRLEWDGVVYHNPYTRLFDGETLQLLRTLHREGACYGACVDAITLAYWRRGGGVALFGSKEEMRRLRRLPGVEVESVYESLLQGLACPGAARETACDV